MLFIWNFVKYFVSFNSAVLSLSWSHVIIGLFETSEKQTGVEWNSFRLILSLSFIYLSTYCVIEKVISHVGLSFLRVLVATNIPEYLLGKSVFGENFQPTYWKCCMLQKNKCRCTLSKFTLLSSICFLSEKEDTLFKYVFLLQKLAIVNIMKYW